MASMTVKSAFESIDGWDDERLVGQLFSVASGRHAAQNVMGFGGEGGATAQELHEELRQAIEKYHIGAVIYFPPGGDHEPVENVRETMLDLQTASEVPLLISTDQENGTVARVRVGAAHMPGAMALAATQDLDLCAEVGAITAEQLRAVGIFQNLAPVADVITVPDNPGVNIRTAGSDPHAAGAQVAAFSAAQSANGLASTLKHFPGYGSAKVDAHFDLPSIPVSREQWDRTERIPFEDAIRAGVDSVMLGHVIFPALDPDNAATFSATTIQGVLRKDLGFDGVVITDAMDMGGAQRPEGPAEACVSALIAGADQILMPADLDSAYSAVLAAVKDGRLDRARLRESAKRILRLKLRLGLDDLDVPELSIFADPRHEDAARRAAAAALSVRDREIFQPLEKSSRILIAHPGIDPQKRGVNPGEVLRELLEGAGYDVDEILWGGSEREGGPWDGVIPDGVGQAVLVLRDAWKDGVDVAGVVAAMREADVAVTVVVIRSPYDTAGVTAEVPALLTYGDNFYAVEAAGLALVGEMEPTGFHPMPVLSLESAQ